MAKRTQKTQKVKENLDNYVVVCFVDTYEQAGSYESLLKNNDIPAVVKEHENPDSLAVMVPEEFIDEAHVTIDSQNSYEDFYDIVLDDEDRDDCFDCNFDDNY